MGTTLQPFLGVGRVDSSAKQPITNFILIGIGIRAFVQSCHPTLYTGAEVILRLSNKFLSSWMVTTV
jgi:hypothetical protein